MLSIASLPLAAQDMVDKKEKDANGNIILEEGYYTNDEKVRVGSVKTERKYDAKNRKLWEKTYYWDRKGKRWYDAHEENHEYTETTTKLTTYEWEDGKRRPSYMNIKTNDKKKKYKEELRLNWDTIANDWSKTMGNKNYFLSDSLEVEEAYSRNHKTNEYWGVRREIRLRGRHPQRREMLMKDKWDKQQQKWFHDIRSTSWQTNSKSYDMIELYDREKKKWVPDKKVATQDEDHETLYIFTDGKWRNHKRTKRETTPEGDRLNLYIWDSQSGKWEKHMSRMEAVMRGRTMYLYYLWNKATSSWDVKQNSHELNISVGKQYNKETDKWEALDRNTMIRFDEKFSFDISGRNDIDIFLHPLAD